VKRLFLPAVAFIAFALACPFLGWGGSFTVPPHPRCGTLFETTEGWVGGDGAYTVDLGETRTLWLFGDSLMGRVTGGQAHSALSPPATKCQEDY